MQSMDPLPMHGKDLGVNPDDLMEPPEQEADAKQEILENKDVSTTEGAFMGFVCLDLNSVT